MPNNKSTNSASENDTPQEPIQDSQLSTGLVCPNCAALNRIGDTSCSNCGKVLRSGGIAGYMSVLDEGSQHTHWPVTVPQQQPITLEIEGKLLTLDLDKILTLGRATQTPDETQPDVDLNIYGAKEKGISRQHIKIIRKNILIYVADLGSTNGTLLNGRRLTPHAERWLRSGDELQLGILKIRVRF